ncbi:hypothetical protein R1sor_021710 [Riccia sorocarpa]|uniref:Uncharacterized protein n=1 Tax=Riccia sorocarpa TaxID=122646 RepID=A0ABD3GNK8_9MARC
MEIKVVSAEHVWVDAGVIDMQNVSSSTTGGMSRLAGLQSLSLSREAQLLGNHDNVYGNFNFRMAQRAWHTDAWAVVRGHSTRSYFLTGFAHHSRKGYGRSIDKDLIRKEGIEEWEANLEVSAPKLSRKLGTVLSDVLSPVRRGLEGRGLVPPSPLHLKSPPVVKTRSRVDVREENQDVLLAAFESALVFKLTPGKVYLLSSLHFQLISSQTEDEAQK